MAKEGKEQGYIRKKGSEWCVFSESGKPMGCYPSIKQAQDRLKEIDMFKHMKSGSEPQDCYCPDCGSYSETNGKCRYAECPVCERLGLVRVG
jgi:hypothetical protein